jgi:hypothetical protein
VRPSRKDRARLQGFLRQLFDSEFKLLHTTTTALSLLALLAPVPVLGQVDEVLRSCRGCVTTVDGDFRPGAFVAVLELLGTIVPILAAEQEDDALPTRKAIVEALLLGFEYAKSRQLAYLAFRLLCQVILQSDHKNRISLAALAMPTLQQCTRRANSLLAEAAVDFLMCYAYSQSAVPPPALCTRQQSKTSGSGTTSSAGESPQTRSRSWVYRRSLLTITTNVRGDASLIVRRANCTSRWELDACHGLSLNVAASSLLFPRPFHDTRSNNLAESDQPTERQAEIVGARPAAIPKRLALPAELRPSYPSHSSSRLSQKLSSSGGGRGFRTYRDVVADDEVQDTTTDSTHCLTSGAATALPPLPAYDGIGGSPSYYCENAQGKSKERYRRGSAGLTV